jgi:mannose-6-phosphate isomerase-like protein (cupin superfamily)
MAKRISTMSSESVKFAYHSDELLAAQQAGGKRYHEFLRVADMSAGLYVLPANGTDPQQPHTEDEMYYVVRGKGKFTYDKQVVDVMAGTVLYVPKHIEHRFHNIEEELVILVFFAPAEGDAV